ncbi:MAG: sulfite exporter TauE/SafE family protein [Ferruginibacter sp.]
MTQFIIAGLTTGLLGSLHCIGMCGPLALSLPLDTNSRSSKIIGATIYNTGRVVTYTLLGILVGLIGKTFSFFGFQQYLSIFLGALIVLMIVVPKKYQTNLNTQYLLPRFFSSIRFSIATLFKKETKLSFFIIGMLNGLLPCGLIYIALATAATTGDWLHGSIFMMFFGLGTLPAMWSLIFFGQHLKFNFRKKIQKAYPYLMICMACLLILRGMGLGISYVSPAISKGKNPVLQCCHK